MDLLSSDQHPVAVFACFMAKLACLLSVTMCLTKMVSKNMHEVCAVEQNVLGSHLLSQPGYCLSTDIL